MTELGDGALAPEPRRVRRLARLFGRRRARTVMSAVLLVAVMLPVLGSSATGDTLSTGSVTHCPGASHPHTDKAYGAQFQAHLGVDSPVSVMTPGGLPLTIPKFSADVCGLIEFVCPSTPPPCQSPPAQVAVVDPSNVQLTINGVAATLGQANLPLDAVPAATSGGVQGVAFNGGLNLVVHAQVKNTTRQLGVSCDTLVNATLSSLPPGTPLTGPLNRASAMLTVALEIPPNATAAAPNCPSYLANQIGQLITLPLTRTSFLAKFTVDICVIPVKVCPRPLA